MKKSLLLSLLAVTAVQFLSGCASTAVLQPQAKAYYDQTKAQIAKENVAVVTDACFGWSEIGTSHYVKDISENLGKSLSVQTTDFLKGAGVNVVSSNTPLVCGFFAEADLKKYSLKQNSDSDREEIKDFPIVSSSNTSKINNQNYLELFKAVSKAVVQNDASPEIKIAPQKLDISDEVAKAIFEDTQSNYVWVAGYTAGKTSFARKFGIAVLTATISAGATGGASASFLMVQDGAFQRNTLVKLDTKEVLWHKTLVNPTVDPLSKNVINPAYVKFMMAPFYPIEPVVKQ